MLDIEIKTIPHKEQRYNTVGDYYNEGSKLLIRVSKQEKWQYEFLIAVHELLEKGLTRHRGIPEEEILEFDTQFKGADPGASAKAPYQDEHLFAEDVERALCEEMGLDWDEYMNSL